MVCDVKTDMSVMCEMNSTSLQPKFVRMIFIFSGIPITYADPVAEFIFNISKYPKQGKDSVFRVENRQVFY